MSYVKEIIEYFNSVDTREIDDLYEQILEGSYDDVVGHLTENELAKFLESLSNNEEYTPAQLDILKKINHIGAKIILESKNL